MGAPSKEEIAAWTAEVVDEARRDVAYWAERSSMGAGRWPQAVVALADEVERLRAERSEVLALLESGRIATTDFCDGADDNDEPISEECYDPMPCSSHKLAALVAKLRGAP